MSYDPVTMEVIRNKVNGIVTEMQNAIFRTGYSSVIRESKDASAGVTDARGRLVGQAVYHPLHVGVFTPAVEAMQRNYGGEINPGDIFLVNCPYEGGSPHTNDFMVISPAFVGDDLVAYCCNIAHKPDIGGTVPGSASGGAREIFHEGLLIPPIKYFDRGAVSREIRRIIGKNSRLPETILGDLEGQIGCTLVGIQRLRDVCAKYGTHALTECFDVVLRYTRDRVLEAIRTWPAGVYEADGWLEHDGVELGKRKRIHLKLTVRGDWLVFDFEGSDDQTQGPANVQPHIVNSICQKAIINFVDPSLPCNGGVRDVFEARLRDGSILRPRFPAPCSAYFPTAQLASNVVLKALGECLGEKAIASCGTGAALSVSGLDSRTGRTFVYYEILASAIGARTGLDGVSGISEDLHNVRIPPVEMVETEYPLMIECLELITDSGGAGQFRGGLGYRRAYRALQDVTIALRDDKHIIPAWGINGGLPGRTGAAIINPGQDSEDVLPSKFAGKRLGRGDLLCIDRPGGGGLGEPKRRERSRVEADVLDGYVSSSQARDVYGAGEAEQE